MADLFSIDRIGKTKVVVGAPFATVDSGFAKTAKNSLLGKPEFDPANSHFFGIALSHGFLKGGFSIRSFDVLLD